VPVLKTRTHAALEALGERLEALSAAVPERASGFHRRRAELASEVGELRSNWLPRLGDDRLGELEAGVSELEELAPELGELLASTTALEEEVDQLRQRAVAGLAELGEDVCRLIDDRCGRWRERLAAVAAEVTSADALDPERRLLPEVEGELRDHFQALFWLERLERALAGFPEEAPEEHERTASRLREELLAEGVGGGWLAEIRRRVEEVEERVKVEAERPRELTTVSRLLPLVRGWSREVGAREDAVRELDRRYREVVVDDWRTPLPAELASRARELEAELVRRAGELRGERIAELQGRFEELLRLGGEQTELRRQIATLERREVRRPQNHRGWLREHTRLAERVAAIADSHRGELERRLDGRLGELRDALAHLRGEPLSDEVAARARRVERRAGELADPEDAAAALDGVQAAAELLREIAELRRRSLEEVEALRAAQIHLQGENEALLAEAGRVDVPVADLGPRIDELTVATEGARSLERSQRAAAALAEEVVAAGRSFVGVCRERLEEELGAVREVAEALAEVSPATAPALPPPLPDDADPEDAAAAVMAAAEVRGAVEERAREAASELEARRCRALEELRRRDLEELDPGEREVASGLTAELEEGGGNAAATPGALRRLARLLGKVELLDDRLEAGRRAVAEARAELCRRLGELREEHPENPRPRLAARLTALIYGLPDPPPPSADVRHQLAVAEELCDRLEDHARRRAARAVVAGVRELEARVRGGGEPGRDAELLAELERHGTHTLPPATLRRRLERRLRRRRSR